MAVILVAVCFLSAGMLFAKKSMICAEQITACVNLCNQVEEMILFKAYLSDDIFKYICTNKAFSVFGFEYSKRDNDISFSDYISSQMSTNRSICMEQEDKHRLIEFLSGIGSVSNEHVRIFCKQYRDYFQSRVVPVSEQCSKNKKMFSALGIYSATLAVILFV